MATEQPKTGAQQLSPSQGAQGTAGTTGPTGPSAGQMSRTPTQQQQPAAGSAGVARTEQPAQMAGVQASGGQAAPEQQTAAQVKEKAKATPAVTGVEEGDKVRVRGADGKEFEATVSRVWSPQHVRVEWKDEDGTEHVIENVSNGGDEQRFKDVVLSKV